MRETPLDVSIIIPVFNKLEFTRSCLDRIARNTSDRYRFEVIIIDNASTDGTRGFFENGAPFSFHLNYRRNASNVGYAKGNNIGAGESTARYLLFLNNDTLPMPGWLEAMLSVSEDDGRVGAVGIKQLFPYTDLIHHTGIVFTAAKKPAHIY